MSRTDTWMPLYIGDYLGDTMSLTTVQHGAYLLLLMEYWRRGPLPNSDDALAAITRVERGKWARDVGPVVREFFTVHADGRLHQKRVDNEREKAVELSRKRAEAGRGKGKTGAVNDSSDGGNGGSKPDTNGVQNGSKSGAIAQQLLSKCSTENEVCIGATAENTGPNGSKRSVPAFRDAEYAANCDISEVATSGRINSDRHNTLHTSENVQPVCSGCSASRGPIEGDLGHDDRSNCSAFAKQLLSNSRANAEQLQTHARVAVQLQSQLPKPESKKSPASLRESPPLGRRSRVEPDWQPDEAGRQFAFQRGVENIPQEVAQFVDHHTSRGNTMADWPAAWRTWCRNARTFARPVPKWSPGRKGVLEVLGLLPDDDDGSGLNVRRLAS